MRLKPIQSICRDRTDVKSVNVRCVSQLIDKFHVAGDRGANQRRTGRLDHLVLRTLDHGCEREHELFRSNLTFRAGSAGDHRTNVGCFFQLDHTIPILCRAIGDAVLREVPFDHVPHGLSHSGNRERRQSSFGVLWREGFDRAKPFSECFADRFGVTRRVDGTAVDAAAPAVDVDALNHHVEILLPIVNAVVAKEDFREAGAMDLDARVARILVDGFLTAEDHATSASREQCSANIVATGIK